MREKTLAAILLITIVLIALHSMLAVVAASPSLSYVYSFDDKGIARVTIIVSGLTGLLEYSFPVYEQVVNESLIAFDENGNVVLVDYNGTYITIYPYNTTDKVIVQFNAIPSTIENDIITATIHPYGPATIILPDNAGLLYFNDTPQIEIIGETIKLYYNESGGYEIQYIVVNTTTTTQTTTTTTTPTTTTTSSPIQTTTTSPTTTITAQTTTTFTPTATTTTPSTTTTKITTTTSTQPTTTTTTSPQPTIQTTTKSSTTTSSPISTGSPITTTTQTTTTTTTSKPATTTPITIAPSTSIQTTTTRGGGAGFPTIVVVFIVAIIVLLIVGYILYKIRFSKTMEETSTQEQERRRGGEGGETSIVMEEPRAIDERDKLLLEKIAAKPMTISELARETGLSKSTVWRRIRKLEKEGYVKTREEGKYIYIEITDKGKQVLGT